MSSKSELMQRTGNFKRAQLWRRRERFQLIRTAKTGLNRPVIVDKRHGVFEVASFYLRYLDDERNLKRGTLEDIGYTICKWLNFLNERGVVWNTVSRSRFIEWSKIGLDYECLTAVRVSRRAHVVAAFYLYLYDELEFTDDVSEFCKSISSPGSTHRKFTLKFTAPKQGKSRGAGRPIPLPEEVELVLDELAAGSFGYKSARDWLVGKIVSGTGLRAAGVASLTTEAVNMMFVNEGIIDRGRRVEEFGETSIEMLEVIGRLDEFGKSGRRQLFLLVTEKFDKTRYVPVEVDLAKLIVVHILGERQQFLKLKRKISARSGPLFLSMKCMGALTVVAVKDIMKDAFVRAGIRGSGHSLRASFLTMYAIYLIKRMSKSGAVEVNVPALAIMLSEVAGHEKPSTLKPYIDLAQVLTATASEAVVQTH